MIRTTLTLAALLALAACGEADGAGDAAEPTPAAAPGAAEFTPDTGAAIREAAADTDAAAREAGATR